MSMYLLGGVLQCALGAIL